MGDVVRILGCPAVCEASESWEEKRAAERRAYEAGRVAWEAVKAAAPAGTGAVIIAQLEKDETDLHSDYFGSKTMRTVVIGYRRGKRESFKALREAAARVPETAHLWPGCDRCTVYVRVTRDDRSAGFYLGQFAPGAHEFALHGAKFNRRAEAEAAIAESTETPREGTSYVIHEDSVEHRDNYSMGAGNWLGIDRYSGWQVRSLNYYPGPFEVMR